MQLTKATTSNNNQFDEIKQLQEKIRKLRVDNELALHDKDKIKKQQSQNVDEITKGFAELEQQMLWYKKHYEKAKKNSKELEQNMEQMNNKIIDM